VCALRSIAAEKQPLDFPLQLRQGGIQRFPSRIDDNGPLWAQTIEVEADGLSDAPLDPVAHHGFTQGARYSEADVGTIGLRFANAKSRKERAGKTGTLVVDSAEILRT
jgi:hypothetical protein